MTGEVKDQLQGKVRADAGKRWDEPTIVAFGRYCANAKFAWKKSFKIRPQRSGCWQA